MKKMYKYENDTTIQVKLVNFAQKRKQRRKSEKKKKKRKEKKTVAVQDIFFQIIGLVLCLVFSPFLGNYILLGQGEKAWAHQIFLTFISLPNNTKSYFLSFLFYPPCSTSNQMQPKVVLGYKGRRIKRDLEQMVLKSYLLQEKVVECVVLGEENIALVVINAKKLAFSIPNIKNTSTIVFFFM